MDKYQNQKYTMETVVEAYLDGVPASVKSGLPNFNNVYAAYKAKLLVMRGHSVKQLATTKGVTKSKGGTRAELEMSANEMVAKVSSYTTHVGDVVLRGYIGYTPSQLKRARAEDLVIKCRIIYSETAAHLVVLGIYGVDAIVLEAFRLKIDGFDGMIPKPKAAIGDKSLATENIKKTFEQIDVLLERMDGLVHIIRNSNGDFHDMYFMSRRIIKPGYRTLAVQGSVVDEDGVALGFVMMICKTLKIKKKIGKSGNFIWRTVVDGAYGVRFERVGYLPVEMTIGVQVGVRKNVRVVMRRLN